MEYDTYFLHPGLTGAEIELLADPHVQRLQRLNQLSYCNGCDVTEVSDVYAAANYTRLAHSIMCLGWMEHWLKKVNCPAQKPTTNDYEAAVLRAASLLHDLGHAPYSHALEPDTPYDHVRRTGELVRRGSLSEVLKRKGLEPRDVADAIGGEGRFGAMVNGELDVDKIAYVLWDSLISQISVPFVPNSEMTYDARMLLSYTDLVDGRLALHLDEDEETVGDLGVVAACNLLDSRTRLTIYLYGCAANSKSVTLVRNAVQAAFEKGTIEPKELFGLTDWELEQRLLENRGTRDYVARIRTGRLPATAVAVSIGQEKAAELRKVLSDRDRRLAFEQRTGATLDINPLSRPPKGEYRVFDGKRFRTLFDVSLDRARRTIRSVQEEHDKYVTRRLVAYAEKEPEKVGRKVCSELGIEQPEEPVELPGFAYAYMT